MWESNIIGGSNIYPCHGIPTQDQSFMNCVQDYAYLKEVYDKNFFSYTKITFSKKQKQIVETDMRCVYAKNDPCWGYVDGKGIVSKCINGKCPQIYKCNKDYCGNESENWKMSSVEKREYGYPDKQKKYYLVDLVSDYEKEQYISNPGTAGPEFPAIKEKIVERKRKQKMIIIGYERTRFSDYCDEQMSPIWGYADSLENNERIFSQKVYGSTTITNTVRPEVKKETKAVQKKPSIVLKKDTIQGKIRHDFDGKKLEKIVKEKLSGDIKLTDLCEERLFEISDDFPVLLVFDNPAELAYTSGMLTKTGVEHQIDVKTSNNKKIALCDINHMPDDVAEWYVFLSDSLLKKGSNIENRNGWEKFSKLDKMSTLVIASREYFSFVCENKKVKWGCKNLYGATHICVEPDDIDLSVSLPEGSYEVTLINDPKNKIYQIVNTYNAELIGKTKREFFDAVLTLKEMEEITNNPSFIVGPVINVTDQGITVFGIGHMKFDEY